MKLLVIFLYLFVFRCSSGETAEKPIIQTFVIPHSHMDVGWVYTVQESMHAYAANVYNSVTEELSKDKTRRFISVEQEFFRLWWDNVASDWHKKQLRQLVKEGRLEFVIGGQVMHDEAVTDLNDDILQMTEGHGFLYQTFGVRPRFSWHVDPFGASATTPVLFALAGFNAHVISRIDYNLKDVMQRNKNLQFVWSGSSSLKHQQIFTHVMDQFSYCTPSQLPFSNSSGFYWNGVALFPDPPKDGIYPNMSLPVTKETVHAYAQTMVDNIKQRATWFRTNHVLWPWGCDKQFYNSSVQFRNMDPLINYINQNSAELGVTVHYATLTEYFQAIHQSDLLWDVRDNQDFLPYSTEWYQAWTGFYASRSFLKGVARRASSQLHAAETLFARYRISFPDGPVAKDWALDKLKALRWAVSEVQHHDGITGTESPKVCQMYVDHLTQAMMGADELLAALFLLPHNVDVHSSAYSSRRHTAGLEQHVIVYNPLAWNVTSIVNVTVAVTVATVYDDDGRPVLSQIQRSAQSNTTFDLFIVAELGGLQHKKYVIKFAEKAGSATSDGGWTYEAKGVRFDRRRSRDWVRSGRRLLPVLNQCYKIMMDQDTNLLHSITYLPDKRRVRMTQDFWQYDANGDAAVGPISDNYIFSANGSAVKAYEAVEMEIIPGKILTEIRQYFYRSEGDEDYSYSITTRVPECYGGRVGCHRLEQTYSVGPLEVNTEVILRTTTSINNNQTLYSDDNGYQMMKRPFRKFRNNTVSRNYYPMVRAAFIQDDISRLVMVSDRAHGVSSQSNGQLELMLHRRLWNNLPWNLGYNLTLNDSSVATPTLWMMLGSIETTTRLRPREAVEMQHRPVVMLIDQPQKQWTVEPRGDGPVPPVVLPPNLHLLSLSIPGWNYSSDHERHLRRLDAGVDLRSEVNYDRVLLRILHLFEEGEDPELSKPVTIDMKELLWAFGEVTSVEERSLTGTWALDRLHRWTWDTTRSTTEQSRRPTPGNQTFSVTVWPKQIRTFFVHF